MKANMVIRIYPSESSCVGSTEDCQFLDWAEGECWLFGIGVAFVGEMPKRVPACLDTFKEDEK